MRVQRIHHTGITVSNINRTIEFYTRVLGAQLLYSGDSGTQGVPLKEFQNVVGVKGARLKFAFLRLGDTLVELICYTRPKGSKLHRRHNDVGTPHIAFKVKNVDAAYSYLLRQGVAPLNPPVVVLAKRRTWTKGWKFTYFRGPDGEYLELFQEL